MKFRVEGIYDAKKLGIPQMLILGLQHMFAMFGRYHSGTDPGKQLFSRRRLIHPGNPVLRRIRNTSVPRTYQAEGSGIPWFILCIPWRICYSCRA